MQFSSLTHRIRDSGTDAWAVHTEAVARIARGEEIILLSIGQESDEQTPSDIVEAAVTSLRNGRHHYTDVSGEEPLRNAISQRHTTRTGQRVDASNCAVFAGAQNALFAVAQCLLESGDEVIVPEPYYTTYTATFTATGAELISVPVSSTNDFKIDPEAILARITPKTKAIVLNSPNNPLGAVYGPEQLKPIVAACAEQKIWLISDEVYAELLPPGGSCSPSSLPGGSEVCVTVSSLSKSHRMTGWRLGWAIGPAQLVEHLYDFCMCMSYGLPPFIQDAALAALQTQSDVTEEIRERLKQRRALVLRELANLADIKLHCAVGSMFTVLDTSNTTLSAQDFAWGLLRQHGVALLPCGGFGPSGKNLLRLGLCVDSEKLLTACQAIRDYRAGSL